MGFCLIDLLDSQAACNRGRERWSRRNGTRPIMTHPLCYYYRLLAFLLRSKLYVLQQHWWMKKACNQAQNQCTIWNPKFDQVGTMYWKETRQSFKQLQCKEKEHKLEEKKKKPMQQEKKEKKRVVGCAPNTQKASILCITVTTFCCK